MDQQRIRNASSDGSWDCFIFRKAPGIHRTIFSLRIKSALYRYPSHIKINCGIIIVRRSLEAVNVFRGLYLVLGAWKAIRLRSSISYK